jgi:hypothetical protein
MSVQASVSSRCSSDIYFIGCRSILLSEWKLPSAWQGKDFATWLKAHGARFTLAFCRRWREGQDGKADKWGAWTSEAYMAGSAEPSELPHSAHFATILGQILTYMLRDGVEWARLENGREWIIFRCPDPLVNRFDFSPVYEYSSKECSWFACTAAMSHKGQEPAFEGQEHPTPWGVRSQAQGVGQDSP